jgi:isopenicillin-N epimerase
MTFGHALRDRWPLDPSIVYLNHGTVGAAPHDVLRVQQALRDRMARQPSQFLLREVTHALSGLVGEPGPVPGRDDPTLVRQAAREVAAFVGAAGDDVVFVDNATSGVNTVLRAVPLSPGDEILVTDQAYGAVMNAARFVAARRGATVTVVDAPYPRFDPGELVDRLDRAIGPRTRLLVVDHVTSATALVFPVAAIAERCRARGVAVLVDGAHAPGAIPIDVPSLGVDYYTGNLHKWAQAPQTAAFLWASPARQAGLHPLVISWELGHGFAAEFDMVGTRDVTPSLSAPAGLRFLEDLGFPDVCRWNHDLAWEAGRLLASRWGTTLDVPESSVGTMVTVRAPERFTGDAATASRLRDALLFTRGIEVHVFPALGRVWIRVSAQVYNELSDVERLAEAVLAL